MPSVSERKPISVSDQKQWLPMLQRLSAVSGVWHEHVQ